MSGILKNIIDERQRQDQQHGGPAHDDTHTQEEWIEFINRQCQLSTPRTFCERMTKVAALAVAALAVAAIESQERKRYR